MTAASEASVICNVHRRKRHMKALKMNGINKKIIFLVVSIITASLLGLSGFNYVISKKELSRSNQIILKNAIESTMVEINRNYRYTVGESKWMEEENAKAASLASISDLTNGDVDGVAGATAAEADATSSATSNSVYAKHRINLGESGYFFVVDSKGNIVTHPFLEGNINDLKSNDGKHVIQELMKLAQAGGGTLSYALEKDISLVNDSKTVYTQYFPYWDWVVCAVIYDTELARGSSIILANNLIGFAVIMAISLCLIIIISKRITDPIKRITRILSEVSEGDLTLDKVRINTQDETKLLGDSVNRLIDSLSRIIRLMVDSSKKLSNYAKELKQSSGIVSETTNEVAKAISQMAMQSDEQFRQTVDSVQKVTLLGENIKETADASSKIGLVVQKNLELKEMGLTSVHDLQDATKENNENSAVIEDLVHRIDEHAKDIGEITSIISNVAEQTNLLALNASIEASRAGEHGKGFSVVANEIRKLANATAVATDNIREKINQMQNQSEEAVNFICKNQSGVEKINQAVSQTEKIIGKISDGLQMLIEDIEVIIGHNQEINDKKDEILVMLGNVSDTAQDNSAAIEEISATAEEQSVTIVEISENISQLNNMVDGLNALINEFHVKEN
ncbi:MAG: HAMP domain-containing protein [Lachnospiraceae bacterium]|nr:HAMP domain-containing protein [Lachnospiraceae bacterium]